MDILWRIRESRFHTEVVGAMTRPHRVDVEAGTTFVGVRFLPGMVASAVPVNGESLTDTTVALEAIWRGDAKLLGKRLLQAETAEERGAVLERMLLFRRAVPRAQRGIGLIVERDGQVSLEEVCDIAHLGERHFRRYCLERTGLTPKMLARIVRFRRARLRLAEGSPVSLAQLAVDTGYFDQAHMIRDFRALAGDTPARLRDGTRSPNFPIG